MSLKGSKIKDVCIVIEETKRTDDVNVEGMYMDFFFKIYIYIYIFVYSYFV